MSDELDANKLITGFINSNIDRLVDSFSSGMKGTKNAIRVRLTRTYRTYLERILERHSKAKSFFVRSEPLPIYDFFVPPDISSQQRVLSAPDAAQLASIAPAAIVTGSGGCGKTMFMRHLLVSSLANRERMPVFLELRQLNNNGSDIRSAILHTLNSNSLKADDKYLDLALRAGHFCLLLDGFDELELRIRDRVAEEVQHLAEKYPQNWIFLSSRPDSKLEGWQGFSLFSVEPFDLDRAVELVEKLPFDDPIKSKFIEALRSGLYEEHKSFLSNPLLLSIMLLTYSDIAHIPTKLSLFYNQAYESLFQKHDALKSGFQRRRRTSLDIQDFSSAFAAFCVQSYDRRESSFSRTKALEHFDRAKGISGLDFDSSGILNDSIQAVCLMIEDGLEITFAHRSFQEYFVARFIRSTLPDVKGELIRRFAGAGESDSVIQLLFEIDPYAVEKHYLLPAIDRIQKKIRLKKKIGITHFLRYLKLVYKGFEISKSDGTSHHLVAYIEDAPLFHALHFALLNYKKFPSRDQAANSRLTAAFLKQYSEGTVTKCTSLQTKNPIVRVMMESGGLWGIGSLQRIIEIGVQIRTRHEKTEFSLNAILRSNSGSQT